MSKAVGEKSKLKRGETRKAFYVRRACLVASVT